MISEGLSDFVLGREQFDGITVMMVEFRQTNQLDQQEFQKRPEQKFLVEQREDKKHS